MSDAAQSYRAMAEWAARLDLAERDLRAAPATAQVVADLAEVQHLAAVAAVAVTQKEAELLAAQPRQEDAA